MVFPACTMHIQQSPRQARQESLVKIYGLHALLLLPLAQSHDEKYNYKLDCSKSGLQKRC